MKNLFKKLSLVFALTIGLSAVPLQAGHFVGNGGDHIRATFFIMGEVILKYLEKEGQPIVQEHHLDLHKLASALDITKVKVTDAVLIDNTYSVVDAIGVPGSITLNSRAWSQYIESEADIYYLVLHEMLRENGINDDNYIISKLLQPFPEAYRVNSRLTPEIKLLPEDSLEGILDFSDARMAGNGCLPGLAGLLTRFNAEENVFEIFPRAFSGVADRLRRVDRKACTLSIPFSVPAGRKLVISQVDLNATVKVEKFSSAQLQFEAFAAGQTNEKLLRRVTASAGTTEGRVLLRQAPAYVSDCGESGILRLNSSQTLQAGSRGFAQGKVQAIKVFLKVVNCEN